MPNRSLTVLIAALVAGSALPAQEAAEAALTRLRLQAPDTGEPSGRVGAALGDVDGDGIEDLVLGLNGGMAWQRGLAGAPERRFAALAPLPGAGDLSSPRVTASCEHAGQPHLVDVDGDGFLDLVAADAVQAAANLGFSLLLPDCIAWFRGGPEGFGARQLLQVDGKDWKSETTLAGIMPFDLDGDGRLEYLLEYDGSYPRRLAVLDPDSGKVAELDGVRGHGPVAVDWDGDGRIDLFTLHDGAVRLHRAAADGAGFTAPEPLEELRADDQSAWLAALDWDGDGRSDLLLAETVWQSVAPGAQPLDLEQEQRLDAARAVLRTIEAELEQLNRSRPQRADREAMARRAARREELEQWAAGPRAVVAELRQQASDALIRKAPRPHLTVLLRSRD